MSDKIAISFQEISAAIKPFQQDIVGGLAGASLAGLGTAMLAPGQKATETEEEYRSRRNSSALTAALGGAAAGTAAGHYLWDPASKFVSKALAGPTPQSSADKEVEIAKDTATSLPVTATAGAGAGYGLARGWQALDPKNPNSAAGFAARLEAHAKNAPLAAADKAKLDAVLKDYHSNTKAPLFGPGHSVKPGDIKGLERAAAGYAHDVPRKVRLHGGKAALATSLIASAASAIGIPALAALYEDK